MDFEHELVVVYVAEVSVPGNFCNWQLASGNRQLAIGNDNRQWQQAMTTGNGNRRWQWAIVYLKHGVPQPDDDPVVSVLVVNHPQSVTAKYARQQLVQACVA